MSDADDWSNMLSLAEERDTLRARVAELEAKDNLTLQQFKDYVARSMDDEVVLRARVAELEAERNNAYGYAKGFLQSFIEQNFPPNPDWRPLPDLLGVLTQIDNASTITRTLRARIAQLEAAKDGGSAVTKASDDVLAERERQKSVEGYDATHDDAHDRGELARAAVVYALEATGICENLYVHGRWKDAVDLFWPWSRKFWKPKDSRRNLVRAGALIIAEIERLDRAALAQESGK